MPALLLPFASLLPPRHYGVIIVAVATLAKICTAPGQSAIIGIHLDSVMSSLSLSRSQISLLYLIATVASSAALPLMGKLVDLLGPRLAVTFIASGLGVACLFASLVEGPIELLVAFFALRFFGQGSMMLVAQYTINLWWVKRRGLAMGIGGSLMSLGMLGLIAPWARTAVDHVGWRNSYRQMGAAELLIMLPIGVLFFRAAPEVFGQLPDGRGEVLARADGGEASELLELGAIRLNDDGVSSSTDDADTEEPLDAKYWSHLVKEDEEEELKLSAKTAALTPSEVATTVSERDVNYDEGDAVSFTAAEALRTGAFWALASGSMLIGASATAYFFHMSAMCKDASLSKAVVASAYPLYAACAVISRLIGGYAIDKSEPRTILCIALVVHSIALALCAALLSLSNTPSSAAWKPALLWSAGLAMAVSGALMNNTAGVAYAQFFGRKHLASIGGYANALIVLGSALGPYPFGAVKDSTGSFRDAYAVAAGLPLLVGVVVLCKGTRPRRPTR